ncbi:hypothetical protein AHAS_Ahas04G0125800 [Arachis hypogaea]
MMELSQQTLLQISLTLHKHKMNSLRLPTVNMDTEQLLQTQGSSTPSVNAAINTRPPLALSLPSLVQEELMKDDFIYVPPQKKTQQTSNNDCPQEAEKHGVTMSLTSSVIDDLFKDDYVYEVSNEDPVKEQQQQAQKPPVQQQSEQEAPVNICPPEPRKQGVMGSLTSSIIDDDAQPREKEDERPSFSFGISPSASQPSQPSQESVSQLEILAEVVVDAGVTVALKFAEGTSPKLTLPAAQVYKTPQKKTKITNELIEKYGSNEYEPVFILKHEALYEGLREYFMSLILEEQVHAVNFILETHGVKYIDKRTKKAYMFDIQQYAHHYQFLDKRKLASHPFVRFNNFPDEGVRWGGTLNGGWTGRGNRVYPIEWSTYKIPILSKSSVS